MITKELKRLSRMELLQLLLVQTQETERLKKDNEELKARLECRTLQVTEAGNIAEATMKINGVMEAAQEAARQYLDNIHELNEKAKHDVQVMEDETRRKCRSMEEATMLECQAMKEKTELQCARIEEATQRKCDELTGKAIARAQNASRKKGRR